LIEKAQATLARMPIAERAYTLLKSESHKFPIQDWIASEHGGIGSNMALVFEGANGVTLESVKVPAFFTYGGFYLALWDRIPSIEETLNKEKWVLGPAATQGPMSAQYSSLHAEIVERYTAEFIAAWNQALGELQLRPMLADKPQYVALSAVSAPTSPLVYLLESIRDETALTRERKSAAKIDSSVARQAEQDAINLSRLRMQSQFNEAIDLAWKNQSRAGEFARDQSPAAGIENAFKQFTILVDGEPGSRKIDSLLVDLNKLYVALSSAAANPTQAGPMLAEAQGDIAALRANKSRVPDPIKGWIEKIASEAAGDRNAMSIAELADSLAENVTAPCHRIIDGHYPFGSGPDVPLADFGRLFMPNGIIDRFFATNLAPLVDQTGKYMTWRAQPDATRKLSDATLREFQLAQDIRDTFFPGGGSLPNVNFEVRLQTLDVNAQTATLTVNGGAPFVAQSGAPSAAVVNWPGAGPSGASIALAPEMPDQKSTIERQGPWALFHLVDLGSPTPRGSLVNVGFLVGQRDVSYQFSVQTAINPLKWRSLSQFKCPTGL